MEKIEEKIKQLKIVYPDLEEMPDDIYANNVRVSYNMLVAFYGANLLKYNSYSRFKDFIR
jgi:hypothetical protein